MSYFIHDIEVTDPLPTLTLSEQETGVAVLFRRKGRPMGFWMEALSTPRVLTPDDLARRISKEIGMKLLEETIREELGTAGPQEEQRPFPSLTVAVCTKDRSKRLARCLDSLQALDPSEPLEVLVIDNAPSDGQTKAVVRARPGVRYAREPKPGLDFARNRAIEEATGELLAFLDDDVVVDHGWLDGLQEAWARHPDAAAFTGQVLPYELSTEAQILFEKRGGFRNGFDTIRYGKQLPGNPLYPCGAGIFGAGANMTFRRDVLKALGGFDEALDTGAPLPGGGDLDIFYRVVRAGYPLVYEPNCLVFHEHRREMGALRRQYWSWGASVMAFITKSYQTDPSQRTKIRRFIRWWFKKWVMYLQSSLRGRYALPPGMLLVELWGAIMGLFGEYSRSSKRIAEINEQFS